MLFSHTKQEQKVYMNKASKWPSPYSKITTVAAQRRLEVEAATSRNSTDGGRVFPPRALGSSVGSVQVTHLMLTR